MWIRRNTDKEKPASSHKQPAISSDAFDSNELNKSRNALPLFSLSQVPPGYPLNGTPWELHTFVLVRSSPSSRPLPSRGQRRWRDLAVDFCARRVLGRPVQARGIFSSEQGEEMPAPAAGAAPIRLGAPHPYLKTHGAKVARLHMVDWIVLLLLAAADVGLNLIEPFHRFVGKGMMDTLLYPLKDNTVPVWAVPVIAVAMPMLIFAGIYVKRKNAYDLHHAILGLLFSVLITGVLTDAIKDGVGRPRPNFYWRCFPNGVPNYNNITGQVICHGEAAIIKEGHKSFPSGHTSWSFAGLGFLSWYLAGKIRAFDRGGHIAKLCIIILPLLLAAMVGVSRVDDYWHHWQDVFAGGILGLVVASFCYLQFFPSPSGEHGHWPHAYRLHILNPETENQVQTTGASTSDRHQSLPRDMSIVPFAVGMEMRTTARALDSMEAGSRTQ